MYKLFLSTIILFVLLFVATPSIAAENENGYDLIPLGYWKFDENNWIGDCQTTDILDSSGNNHHGTACINGDAPIPVPGKFGNAGYFDGINQYADMGPGFNFTSSFTASLWIALEDYDSCGPQGKSQHIIGTHHLPIPTGNGRGWGIYWDCDGLAWELTNSTGTDIQSYGFIQPDPFPSNGSWHHIALVYDSTEPSASLYWDGNLVYTESGTENVPSYLFNNGEPLTVNGLPYAPSAGAPGKVDDTRVYDRALSLAEIQVLMASPKTFEWGSIDESLLDLTSYGVYDTDNATVLQTGDQAQLIWTGPDGQIAPPMPDGQPGGDDQLLDTTTIVNENPLPTQLHNHGAIPLKTYTFDVTDIQNNGLIYIRAWNAASPATATAYGDSQTATLTTGGSYNALRWYTNILMSTWTGAAGGSWGTASNWSNNVVPGATTYAIFPTGSQVVLGANSASYVLHQSANSSLDLGAFQLTVEAGITSNGVLSQSRTIDSTCTQGSPCSLLYIQNAAGTQVRFRGVDLWTTNDLGQTTVSISSINSAAGEHCTSTGATSPAYAERCFSITPTNNLGASVRLWALTSELNGIQEADLVLYRYVSSWVALTNQATGYSGTYFYAQGDTTGFSSFLLGSAEENPTALTNLIVRANLKAIKPVSFLLPLAIFLIVAGLLKLRQYINKKTI